RGRRPSPQRERPLRQVRRPGRSAFRALAADRPAPRGRGDDGRAAADARDLRRHPAAAVLARAAGAPAGALAQVNSPASYSVSFEPLFLVLAVAAAYVYIHLSRTVERPTRARATIFALGLVLIALSL